MSIMANYWAAKKWDVIILTLDHGLVTPFFPLHPAIRHVPLGVSRNSANKIVGLIKNMRRVCVLKNAIRASKPDVVISFMDSTNVITVLAASQLGVPVIVSEHTDPEMLQGIHWRKLREWVYPHADRVVVLTQLAQRYFPPKLRAKISVIPNPVLLPPVEPISSRTDVLNPMVISVGRLVHEKGFDVLLRAFAQLKDKYRLWRLTILGEGPMRSELETLARTLQLAGRVSLPGRVTNPYPVLKQADLFVMSSRVEGFGMALCEALATGLPAIATDCRTGPSEIIRHGVDGLLVKTDNLDALTAAMDRLMGNEEERLTLSRRATEVTQRFSLETVMSIWEELLLGLVKTH